MPRPNPIHDATVAGRVRKLLIWKNSGILLYRHGCFVYVIAWGREQLRINFMSIFKVFTKLPESRSDEGNLEYFENTSEINP